MSYSDSNPRGIIRCSHLGLKTPFNSYMRKKFAGLVITSKDKYPKKHLHERQTSLTSRGFNGQIYKQDSTFLEIPSIKNDDLDRRDLIRHTIETSSIGLILIAATTRGLCSVQIGDSTTELTNALTQKFPTSTYVEDDQELDFNTRNLIELISGTPVNSFFLIDIEATVFQLCVWKELCKIPAGETRSYTDIAKAIKHPKAIRAVASACASNPLALIIPCHRVVQICGNIGNYRWGAKRKRTLLKNERREKLHASNQRQLLKSL